MKKEYLTPQIYSVTFLFNLKFSPQMEDPYGFIIPDCKYTSSQENFFNDSLPFREDISPGLYPPPPPTTAASSLDGNIICSDPVSVNDDVNAIIICSAPESQVSDSGEEFKTPPEESRHSSSEEAPPPKLSSLHDTGGNGTAISETDCGVLEGEMPDLGFSQGPKMVEVRTDGENQVKEASVVDHELFRAGEKQSAIKEPPPSEIVRVSVDSLVLVKTPLNLATGDNEQCSGKRKPDSLVEIGVDVNGETQVKKVSDVAHDSFRVGEKHSEVGESSPSKLVRAFVDSTVTVKTTPNPETDSLVEIEVEVGMNRENQVNEVSDVDHESFGVGQKRSAVEEPLLPSKRGRASVEIEGKVEKNVETEAYFLDSGDTVVLDEDYNYGEEYGDNRKKSEDENHLNTQEAADGPVGLLLKILALLAEEERRNRNDNDDGTVNILETAKHRGMKFPEPKWWRELRDDRDDVT